MKQRVLIIDGDLTAYQAAAVVEKRSVEVVHKATGKSKVFDTRTEFKNFLKEQGKPYNESSYNFIDIQHASPVSHACKIVKNMIASLKKSLRTNTVEVWIGDNPSNFRNFLDLPVKYKGSRDNTLRPLNLKETKSYLIDNNSGGVIKNIEADDQVIIRYFELTEEGNEAVVLSRDKDSKGCVGIRLCNPDDTEYNVIEIPAFGEIELVKKGSYSKVQAIGLHNYCWQMLYGDDGDDYSPSDLHNQRFGNSAIVKYLKKCSSVDELFQAVEDKYKEWFPEPITYITWDNRTVTKDYKDLLEMYHLCVYMKRKQNDNTTFYSLWEEFK